MAPSEPAPSSIGWSGRGVATRLRGGKSVLCAYGRRGHTSTRHVARARARPRRIGSADGSVAWRLLAHKPGHAVALVGRRRPRPTLTGRAAAVWLRCRAVAGSDHGRRDCAVAAVARALRALVPCPWLVASYVYDGRMRRRAPRIQIPDHDVYMYILAFFQKIII